MESLASPRKISGLRCSLDFARNDRLINASAYEHTRTYRYHLDRKRIPISRPRLELSHGSRLRRERSFLNAVSRAMDRFREARRKCDSSIFLVLEHCRQRADVRVLRLPSRPGRHSRIFAKFFDLHSQLDAHPKTQVRVHRRSALATSTRGKVMINRAD